MHIPPQLPVKEAISAYHESSNRLLILVSRCFMKLLLAELKGGIFLVRASTPPSPHMRMLLEGELLTK